ncbi:uncharacterized protein (DUF488 family) [Litorivivens lipolytica]|uniref:Uncharacterized protein (DUF488 family) n=1 Tax=Litorivivens lipolytica TaxID=1524264 RepID=A0A7W4Z6E5_9GAMM|nr:DUF488 domain-containing protein [Litorivivens lipolytica]MBB3048137.1 uncharacterized protein (DUF488 family) [Litorivivens lipolytica]
MAALFSIGYATKPIETFIKQLQAHRIDVVADVRSVPYSKAFHDYHRERLIEHLRQAKIRYVYLGEELGPRSPCDEHYDYGQVQFERLQRSEPFQRGIKRLLDGLDKGFRIALTCAEKDPAVCHRSLLIAQFLKREHNLDIAHIDHEGALESESELARRLLDETGIVPDMLTGEEECLINAWREQSRRFAYRRPDEN